MRFRPLRRAARGRRPLDPCKLFLRKKSLSKKTIIKEAPDFIGVSFSLSKSILDSVERTQKFLVQLFSKSWSGPGLKALVARRSG
ncbi:MAG: hypothetical protein IKN55_07385 [Oscillospiraceae bacterium]|nr:hypothetical protein [Oscillospiraceae bacterium]